ncbi:MAG: hypothetical protein ACODAJ_10085, partial [Planctomycetota bacterium]
GDIAFSVDGPSNPPPPGEGYEYGIVIAPPGVLWNSADAGAYDGKEAGQVWHRDGELDWFLPDSDRAVNSDSFSNFKATADAEIEHPTDPDYEPTEDPPGTFTYADDLLSFYYGPALDDLPDGEGSADDGKYPLIEYVSGTDGSNWIYSQDGSELDVDIDTYVFEGQFARSIFGAANEDLQEAGSYYVHWTMGCANDLLPLEAEVTYVSNGVIPEPFSAAFAVSALGIVVAARARRRKKRSGG